MCKFLNPQHCNTLCIRDYLFLKNLALSNDDTQRSSLYRVEPQTYAAYEVSDIFRIGAATGYREGMLNLLNLFGLECLVHLSQFHIVLFYVLLFHVLHFHVLSFGPSFSRQAFSAPPCEPVVSRCSPTKYFSSSHSLYGATCSPQVGLTAVQATLISRLAIRDSIF